MLGAAKLVMQNLHLLVQVCVEYPKSCAVKGIPDRVPFNKKIIIRTISKDESYRHSHATKQKLLFIIFSIKKIMVLHV